MSVRDIKILQKQRDERLAPEQSVPAVVVAVSGSVNVSGRTSYIWVSEFNQPQSLIQALNLTGVQPIEGNLIELGNPNQAGIRQVLRMWDGAYGYTTDSDGLGALSAPPHSQAHQYPSESGIGPDPVLVFQPALQVLKCTGDGATLSVTVMPLDSYRLNDTHKSFSGSSFDLTSSVPSISGTVRYALVYLNAQTNSLDSVDGTAVPNSGAILIPKPAVPDYAIPSAYVKLAYGQSAIVTATHVVDAREFLHLREEDGVVGGATEIGQILYSVDGISFAPHLPMVASDGGIMMTDDGHIMVVA